MRYILGIICGWGSFAVLYSTVSLQLRRKAIFYPPLLIKNVLQEKLSRGIKCIPNIFCGEILCICLATYHDKTEPKVEHSLPSTNNVPLKPWNLIFCYCSTYTVSTCHALKTARVIEGNVMEK